MYNIKIFPLLDASPLKIIPHLIIEFKYAK